MDCVFYQIFKINLSKLKKKHGEKNDDPSIRVYTNKIENKITFKIITGYYLERLTPETMKLFGSTKSRMKMAKLCLRVLYLFIPNKSFGQLLDISPKKYIFLKTLIQNFHTLKYDLLIKILNR